MTYDEALKIISEEGKPMGNCLQLLRNPYRENPDGVIRNHSSEYDVAKGFVEGYRHGVKDVADIALRKYEESLNSNGPLFGIYDAANILLRDDREETSEPRD